ncbi:MAG TPA: efflux RND transporter periplasmic adaptor subunit [Chthonomonadales bacterium]|nr:efflux RND transporter periplasmic adaptor subunit [Chthonomonadales bacterium]
MRRIGIIAAVVMLFAAGAAWAWLRIRSNDGTEEVQYKLQDVTRDRVRKTVSATGTLKPWAVVDIKSKAGGRVDALLVTEGSEVKRGQVLAKIDPTDTLLNVNTARADIDSARAREMQSDGTWRLQIEQSATSVASARASLASAEASLSAAKVRLERARTTQGAQPRLWRMSVEAAEAQHEAASKQRKQLDSTQAVERATAQASYDQAKANLDNGQANYGRQQSLLARGFVSQQAVDQARASYEVSAAQVRSADARLRTIGEEQRAAIDAADARVKQALAGLESARAQEADVRNADHSVEEAQAAVQQAEAQVRQQRAAHAQAQANVANNDIRRFDIATAQASLERARASFANARTTLDQTVVRAPSDGVILQKYVEEGTIVSSALSFAATGNNILQLGDVTRMYVDVTVDETDIATVREGQQVDIMMDAYPGVPFEGTVTRIDPQAVVEQNVTQIHVRVEVDNSAPAFRLLKPGMNATCEFIDDEREDVVCVPSEALRTDDKGQFVEVGTGGQPAPPDPKSGDPADPDLLVRVKVERRDVQVGLEGNDVVEIRSGVTEGEKVVVQTIEPVKEQAGSPFGGGGPGMGRGMGMGRGR